VVFAVTFSFCGSADSVAPEKRVEPNDPIQIVRVAASVRIVLPYPSLEVGDSMIAVAVVLDADGATIPDRTAQWTSANPSVATVSDASVITAIAPGTTAITAQVDQLTATADIEVTAPPPAAAPPQTALPELPRRKLDTKYVQPTGVVWRVRAGDNLQTAIDGAGRGDAIELEAGAVFTGNFVLRPKGGTGWITIRTATPDESLPAEGTRIQPSLHQSLLARIQTADPNKSVFVTAAGASGYRLLGLEITARSDITSLYALIQLGEGNSNQRTLESVPSDLILDRVWVHGHQTLSLLRCVALNSASSAIVDSYLSDCHAKGFDSQVIEGWNGPGPYKIENNYLEGAGENVMFGGADSQLPELMPADIEIVRNHFYKPVSWKGVWTIKNLMELKVGRRILIEGNVFEHCWVDGQTGFALTFKSVNQGGRAPWSQTSDITMRYNLVRRSAAGLNIAGKPQANPAIPMSKVLIEHNVFSEIGDFAGTTNGRMLMLMNELKDIEIRHNTLLHNALAGQFLLFADKGPARGFIVRDNIATKGGPWGAVMGTAPQGIQALAAFAQTYTFAGNVVVGLQSNLLSLYPINNHYAASLDGVGLADAANGDFSLTPASQYYGGGTGAANPGADWTLVSERIRGVVLP
jgi:hypothetical protein